MKDKKGFTLIEVISVMIIIAILVSLASVQYAATIKSSRKRLNDEQKSRITESAKNISLNNRNCLTQAKNDPNGVKISLEDMKKYGYISNKVTKDLEENTILNSCVIIKWDEKYSKFNYEYVETCPDINTCIITAETEKVLVSSFYLEEGNPSYTNKKDVTYYLKYSSSINAEYCVTLENEASCNWKKLNINSTDASGKLTLKNVENIAHLYIRNSNKNIIATITDSIAYDVAAPTCRWLSPSNDYVKNGSTTELTLRCEDTSGIKNTELLKSSIIVSNTSLATVSDAIVVENGSNKDFRFVVSGLEGNGSVTLQLLSNEISDNSGNLLTSTITSNAIKIDNIAPDGTVQVKHEGNVGSAYTNTENIELEVTNVSSDIDSVCISNIDNNCTDWKKYKSSYDWVLQLGDGSKKVYVSLKDKAGNINKKDTTIYLDKTAPTCVVEPKSSVSYDLKSGGYNEYLVVCSDNYKIGSFTLSNSDLFIDNPLVTASITNQTSNEITIKVTALTGDGRARVYINTNTITDSAGNKNSKQIEIANLNIDNTPPLNTSIKLNYGATITNNRLVNVVLSSDSITGYYCLTLTNDVSSCTWNDYANLGSFLLKEAAQNYTIYAFFKDVAGNVTSNGISSSINYNPDAVSCYLTTADGKVTINSSYASLDENPYSWDNKTWSTIKEQILAPTDKTYRAFIKDASGNVNYCELSYEVN